MRSSTSLLVVMVVLHGCFAPPAPAPSPGKNGQDIKMQREYEKYLDYYSYMKDVVKTLESDPAFLAIVLGEDEEFRQSVRLADYLGSTSQHIREKLHELKRRELQRLRHLATKKYELSNNLEMDTRKVPSHEHLDHSNPHTFEMEDLKRLIQKTLKDIEIIDELRRQQFKEYEMQKEFKRRQKMENMTESEKKEFIEKENQEKEAKKQHQPLHHPVSKQQLEEVWEKQDQMDQQFDPKVFFMMHDVDGNGVWGADELKALFVKELDKVYGPNGPNKDMRVRAEEMERMREYAFRQNDLNHDGLIQYEEFLGETKKPEFKQDEGWRTIDENQIYTQSEYEEYQKRHLAEQKYLQSRGLVDDHGNIVPGAEQLVHRAQLEFAAQYQQQQDYQKSQGQNHQQGYQVPSQGYQAHQGQFQQPSQGQFEQPQGQSQQQPLQGQQPLAAHNQIQAHQPLQAAQG